MNQRQPARTTIADIARASGVSPATVSAQGASHKRPVSSWSIACSSCAEPQNTGAISPLRTPEAMP